ncbi:IS630 transposase-related protein [Microseira sp. BLCC-F43]|jgi:transposase|uniref:IS630 transposase-related protein n=1 Tax=Microseira sp. BLCC-F43 TaxID=3153602 RepID=UPI0035B8AF9E
MARAYSLDLRIRALDLIAGGMSISKVSRLVNISHPTLYKWTTDIKNTGSTVPKTTVPPTAPSKITDWQAEEAGQEKEKFQEFVERHGDKTQQEMAQGAM